MPCQGLCQDSVMVVMTCECVTHWIWYLMPGSSSSPDHPVTTHLHNNCHIISGTQQPATYWPKFCCPKVSDRRGWFELFHLYTKNSDTWKLSSQARGQWSFAISLPKKDLFQARMDFGLVKQLALAGQIRSVTGRGGKGSGLAVACISWCLHPSCSLSQFLSSRLLPFSFNVGRLIWLT